MSQDENIITVKHYFLHTVSTSIHMYRDQIVYIIKKKGSCSIMMRIVARSGIKTALYIY